MKRRNFLKIVASGIAFVTTGIRLPASNSFESETVITKNVDGSWNVGVIIQPNEILKKMSSTNSVLEDLVWKESPSPNYHHTARATLPKRVK